MSLEVSLLNTYCEPGTRVWNTFITGHFHPAVTGVRHKPRPCPTFSGIAMPPLHETSRREFVLRLASVAAALGAAPALTACGGGSDAPDFAYGVASGDPQATAVML
jgi:hypothetical protein